jgi:hypothetical protein
MGLKGVHLYKGRYQARCDTAPCRNHRLGNFGTPEEAAQAYLQHWEEEHPEEHEKERQRGPRAPPPVLLPVQEHLLIRSDRSSSGFKGVYPNQGRYQAKCDTAPCRHHFLGRYDTPEEAAQAYLQHCEKEHPEELEKERAPRPVLRPVQEHLLIRSAKNITGYKGVRLQDGRYRAVCQTPPCHHHHLGTFGTPEEAAQAYLQHWEKETEEHEKERQRGPRAPPPVLLPVQEHLLIRSDKGPTGFKNEYPDQGRYQATCSTAPCHHNHLGTFETPEEAAQAYLQHHQERRGHITGLVHTSRPPRDEEGGHAVIITTEGKKRKQPVASLPEAAVVLSHQHQHQHQFGNGNEALKRCKQEFVEEDHAAL